MSKRIPWMLVCCVLLPAASFAGTPWRTTWMASPEAPWRGSFPLPTLLPERLWQQTLRQPLRVSVGGDRIRVVLSNEFGTDELTIGNAHLARCSADAAIEAGSDRVLHFGGHRDTRIAAGTTRLSDAVDLDVAALDTLCVSLYLPEPTAPDTFHWDARQTAYVAAGDQSGASRLQATQPLPVRLFVREVLVAADAATRTVIAIGDSITDGNGSTPDTNRRWPDALAARLAGRDIAVLNAGISGGRLLRSGMGPSALQRFDRDVLAHRGATTVIVLLGINDIAWPGHVFAPREPVPTVEALIDGYRELIARAHAHGLRIVGGTLTPFEGALQGTPFAGYYRDERDALRRRLNAWIRSSGAFDAVADFDALLRDPQHPQRLRADFDSGDHLHPGDAGYAAMAALLDDAMLFGGR